MKSSWLRQLKLNLIIFYIKERKKEKVALKMVSEDGIEIDACSVLLPQIL